MTQDLIGDWGRINARNVVKHQTREHNRMDNDNSNSLNNASWPYVSMHRYYIHKSADNGNGALWLVPSYV